MPHHDYVSLYQPQVDALRQTLSTNQEFEFRQM